MRSTISWVTASKVAGFSVGNAITTTPGLPRQRARGLLLTPRKSVRHGGAANLPWFSPLTAPDPPDPGLRKSPLLFSQSSTISRDVHRLRGACTQHHRYGRRDIS